MRQPATFTPDGDVLADLQYPDGRVLATGWHDSGSGARVGVACRRRFVTASQLGARSSAILEKVHRDLAEVVRRAAALSDARIIVVDGLRTRSEQKRLYDSGASRTLDSQHLYGLAVDIAPYINGKARWEWPPVYQAADAMRSAARELGVEIVWGGAWNLGNFAATTLPPEKIVAGYVELKRRAGQPVFLDGVHFELPRSLRATRDQRA